MGSWWRLDSLRLGGPGKIMQSLFSKEGRGKLEFYIFENYQLIFVIDDHMIFCFGWKRKIRFNFSPRVFFAISIVPCQLLTSQNVLFCNNEGVKFSVNTNRLCKASGFLIRFVVGKYYKSIFSVSSINTTTKIASILKY